jgi:hypothetical protein
LMLLIASRLLMIQRNRFQLAMSKRHPGHHYRGMR